MTGREAGKTLEEGFCRYVGVVSRVLVTLVASLAKNKALRRSD